MQNLKWRVNFLGLGEGERGEVVTDDGEVIGHWTLDAEDHPSFTQLGETKELFWDIGIPLLARTIVKWLDGEDGQLRSESWTSADKE